jgi:formate/nitrite transporter
LYANAVTAGAKKANLAPIKILQLSIISGAHISFGAIWAVCVGMNVPEFASAYPGLGKLLLGLIGLPFGLYMTIVTGAELFTGNTALVTAALIEGKATFRQLLKSWSLSFLGNLLGSLLLAAIATHVGVITNPNALIALSTAKISSSFTATFLKGVLCNWLVCMAVYMSIGSSSAIGKFTSIILPISAFMSMGLEHSVANMFFIPAGMMVGSGVSVRQFLFKNLLPVTLGNIVGGAAAVAGGFGATYGTLFQKKVPSTSS